MTTYLGGYNDLPSIWDVFQRERESKAGAFGDYFGDLSGATGGFLDRLKNLTDELKHHAYTRMEDIDRWSQQYMHDPLYGSIGGAGVSWVPKASRDTFNTFLNQALKQYGIQGDYVDYATEAAGAEFGAQTGFLDKLLGFETEYTPDAAYMDYMKWLVGVLSTTQPGQDTEQTAQFV